VSAISLEEVASTVAEHGEAIANLKELQRTQNGTLNDLREEVRDFKESIMKWLFMTTGGVAVSLFLLLVQLAITFLSKS
jgi:hypothetical protein